MLSVKNNLMAANAARHLGGSYDALAKSVERLSSGLRINSAKDDAAGLAVRELVRANVATLQQGARNARDAISMIQTGEGAMAVIDDILVRMKELAEQAATESYSQDQRGIMNAEFQQLGLELTRIAVSTGFNDINLLNSTATYKIHIGTTDTIDVTAEKMDGASLGVTNTISVAANENVRLDPSTEFIDASGGDIDFQFDFADTDEAQVDVVFSTTGGGGAGSYDMYEVVQAINLASQTANTYNAAALIYDGSTNLYTITLTAKTSGANALTIVAGTDPMADADWLKTDGASTGQTIASVNGATTALTKLDDAIKIKDTYRAKLGYLMNRLEAAVSILDIQGENLMAAESRISDVDVATEMAAMTRTQVLAQAGISMLAQANAMPQMALKLLQ